MRWARSSRRGRACAAAGVPERACAKSAAVDEPPRRGRVHRLDRRAPRSNCALSASSSPFERARHRAQAPLPELSLFARRAAADVERHARVAAGARRALHARRSERPAAPIPSAGGARGSRRVACLELVAFDQQRDAVSIASRCHSRSNASSSTGAAGSASPRNVRSCRPSRRTAAGGERRACRRRRCRTAARAAGRGRRLRATSRGDRLGAARLRSGQRRRRDGSG